MLRSSRQRSSLLSEFLMLLILLVPLICLAVLADHLLEPPQENPVPQEHTALLFLLSSRGTFLVLPLEPSTAPSPLLVWMPQGITGCPSSPGNPVSLERGILRLDKGALDHYPRR